MRKTVFSHTCFRSCFVSLLVLLLPLTSVSSASPENHHTSGDIGEFTKASEWSQVGGRHLAGLRVWLNRLVHNSCLCTCMV